MAIEPHNSGNKALLDELSKLSLSGTKDHEALENLLGGDENAHYHLTQSQLDKLENIPSDGTSTINPEDINHEKLKGLLGGGGAGHYHLTVSEMEMLRKIIAFTREENDYSDEKLFDHESLRNLLGDGSGGDHYHLTDDQLEGLKSLLSGGGGSSLKSEEWTFTLENGSTVTKKVALM